MIRKLELLHTLVALPLCARLCIERSIANNQVGVHAVSDDGQSLRLSLLAPQPRSTLEGTVDGNDDELSNDVFLEAVVDLAPTCRDNCLTCSIGIAVTARTSCALGVFQPAPQHGPREAPVARKIFDELGSVVFAPSHRREELEP